MRTGARKIVPRCTSDIDNFLPVSRMLGAASVSQRQWQCADNPQKNDGKAGVEKIMAHER